jgi:hypothetical protein
VNKSGNIGTRTATAVVKVFRERGFPDADRRVQKGAKDEGDLTGLGRICVEIKGGNAARMASDAQIEAWLDETDVETRNSGADIGVLVVARKGIGYDNAHRWWAIVRGSGHSSLWGGMTVRFYLEDWITYARRLGYGAAIEDAA